MSDPPSGRRRLLLELPLLLGILGGWLGSWWRGKAFVLGDPIEGYGWTGYIQNAWSLAHGATARVDYFRAPLHGAMTGSLGEALGSYVDAGVIVSSLSAFGLVLAAGVGARVLGGPWAGAAAAAALPWTANAADCARWANNYPLLAGLTGLTLALALCVSRWPGAVFAGLTGLSAGLAWAADDRGLVVLPCALLLAGVGISRAPRKAWLLVLVAGLALSGKPGRQLLGWDPARALATEQKLEIQRDVVRRWIDDSRDETLRAACADVPDSELLTSTQLTSPCARAQLEHNLGQRLPAHLPFGMPLTLLGAALLLLPGRQGWRGSLEGLSTHALTAGLLALGLLTVLVDRYLLQFTVLFALLPAAGLGRLAQTVLPRRVEPWLQPVLAMALLGWTWSTDPPNRDFATALQRNEVKGALAQTAQDLAARLDRRDALLDCTGAGLSLTLLPWLPHAGQHYLQMPVGRIDDAAMCRDWITAPPGAEGAVYVAILGNKSLPLRPPGERPTQIVLHDVLDASEDWELSWSQDKVELWQHR